MVVVSRVLVALRRRREVAPDAGTSSGRLQLAARVDAHDALVEASSCVNIVEVAFLAVYRVVVARRQQDWTFACNIILGVLNTKLLGFLG